MSFRTIAGNEWRDLGTTGRGRHGAAETAGYPTMHSSVMYGQVEHETGKGRRSGFTVSDSICIYSMFCTLRIDRYHEKTSR